MQTPPTQYFLEYSGRATYMKTQPYPLGSCCDRVEQTLMHFYLYSFEKKAPDMAY